MDLFSRLNFYVILKDRLLEAESLESAWDMAGGDAAAIVGAPSLEALYEGYPEAATLPIEKPLRATGT